MMRLSPGNILDHGDDYLLRRDPPSSFYFSYLQFNPYVPLALSSKKNILFFCGFKGIDIHIDCYGNKVGFCLRCYFQNTGEKTMQDYL